MQILVRDAATTDLDAVEALRQEALSDREPMRYPEDRLMPATIALSGPALVAEVDGQVAGILSWIPVGDQIAGGLFIVARCRRGSGVAQALMREHARRAELEGKRRAFFICEERLTPFYESLGFQRAGVAMERLWPG